MSTSSLVSNNDPQPGMRRYLELVYGDSFVDGQQQKCIVDQIDQFVNAVSSQRSKKTGWDQTASSHHQTALKLLQRSSTVLERYKRRALYFDVNDIQPHLFDQLCRRIALLMLAQRYDRNALSLFEQANEDEDDDDLKYLTSDLLSIRIVDFPYPSGLHESLTAYNEFMDLFGEFQTFKRKIDYVLMEDGVMEEDCPEFDLKNEEFEFENFQNTWAPNKSKLIRAICSSSEFFNIRNNSFLWEADDSFRKRFLQWCDNNIEEHYEFAAGLEIGARQVKKENAKRKRDACSGKARSPNASYESEEDEDVEPFISDEEEEEEEDDEVVPAAKRPKLDRTVSAPVIDLTDDNMTVEAVVKGVKSALAQIDAFLSMQQSKKKTR
jgi:hypothetical protein